MDENAGSSPVGGIDTSKDSTISKGSKVKLRRAYYTAHGTFPEGAIGIVTFVGEEDIYVDIPALIYLGKISPLIDKNSTVTIKIYSGEVTLLKEV